MFEITGCGSCMFVEDRENLEELFKKDVEVIPYQNIEDLILKIKFYSNKMDKIEKIAEKGYIKTINNHTTFHRVLKNYNKIKKITLIKNSQILQNFFLNSRNYLHPKQFF